RGAPRSCRHEPPTIRAGEVASAPRTQRIGRLDRRSALPLPHHGALHGAPLGYALRIHVIAPFHRAERRMTPWWAAHRTKGFQATHHDAMCKGSSTDVERT